MREIINGVDVSECCYFERENAPYYCTLYENECEAQNCYFQQLKRKEQECEKYKKYLADMKELAEIIITDDDKPACVNDDDCPLNGGAGLDNHCNLICPFIIAKKIADKINEVENRINN